MCDGKRLIPAGLAQFRVAAGFGENHPPELEFAIGERGKHADWRVTTAIEQSQEFPFGGNAKPSIGITAPKPT